VKYLLQRSELRALRAFVGPETLIALDYDGTLAPIVARPEDARMADTTRALLTQVAKRYPVVILTGRARIDALSLLAGVPVLEVIGSHGAETQGTPVTRFLRRVESWRAQLRESLRALGGVRIEDKRYSLAVHYRQSEDPQAAEQQISRAAGALDGARLVGGKKVVNVVPEDAPDKGAALLAACTRLGCSHAVFAGDDDTDEAAFAAAPAAQVFTVRIGNSENSRATYYLRAQPEIDELLRALLEARAAAPAKS